MLNSISYRQFASLAPLVAVVALAGCGQRGPTTHAVEGRIELKGEDVAQLTGSTLEVARTSDPTVRGFGEIQPDGSFRLRSLQAGELRTGVVEGQYAARIIPNDEDGESRKRAVRAVAPRFLKFETSGLKVDAPSSGAVVLTVTAR